MPDTKPYRVLVAIDLSDVSDRILEEAITSAAAHPGSELHAISVPEPVMSAFPVVPVAIQSNVNAADVLQEKLYEHLAKRFAPGPAPLAKAVAHSLVGRPADEIVWLAAHLDADLIVLGTHGRRGLKRVLMGSVAERVVRTAGCQVQVVREKQHRADWMVPEIEPVCPECAEVRKQTEAKELWCARHAEPHYRSHVVFPRLGTGGGANWG